MPNVLCIRSAHNRPRARRPSASGVSAGWLPTVSGASWEQTTTPSADEVRGTISGRRAARGASTPWYRRRFQPRRLFRPHVALARVGVALPEAAPHDEILRDFPYLEPDEIKAALAYAARQPDHAVLQQS